MTVIWDRVQGLKGETLYTASRNKPFEIVDVGSERITFVPHNGTGTHRWATRAQIEYMYDRAKAGQEISRQLVQEQYPSDRDSSYITAIIKAIT